MVYMPKMDTKSGYRLIAVAVGVDLLQAVVGATVVGTFITPIIGFLASLGFAQALKQHGIPLTKGGYMNRYIAASIAELIPFVGDLPFWTFTIVSILRSEKII